MRRVDAMAATSTPLSGVTVAGREIMAARRSWQEYLGLSLVTCLVALYPATSKADTAKSDDVVFWVGAAVMVVAGWLFARWLSKRDK